MSMRMLVDIDNVQDNPWQPRESMDPEKVRGLAESIAVDGLLQEPVGRLIHSDSSGTVDLDEVEEPHDFGLQKAGVNVQLAFGHRRLAAYKYNRDNQVPGNWDQIPIVLRDLTDEKMFDLATVENIARNDLNAIEIAKQMERYRVEFGKTSEEIGKKFQLSDSAVRNKIRLLKLPDLYKRYLIAGDLSEGSARDLVTLFEMRADERAKAELATGVMRQDVIDAALSGMAPARVHELVQRLANHVGEIKKQPALPFVDEVDDDVDDQSAPPQPSPHAEREHPMIENIEITDKDFQRKLLEYLEEKEFLSPFSLHVALRISYVQAKRAIDDLLAQDCLELMDSGQYKVVGIPDAVVLPPVAPSGAEPELPDDMFENDPADPKKEPEPIQSVPSPRSSTGSESKTVEEKPKTWKESTVTIAMTYHPDDGHNEGRQISIGARVNGDAPVIKMCREVNLSLPPILHDLYERLEAGAPK